MCMEYRKKKLIFPVNEKILHLFRLPEKFNVKRSSCYIELDWSVVKGCNT